MNLHKFIRRICAAAVAAALTLSLCTPVLAEGIAALPAAETGTSQLDETGDVRIDLAHFPDENFRDRVAFYCGKDDGDALSQDELNGVTELYVAHAYIKDLTGIELFPNLEKLDCKNNNLTRLDVSKNTKLTKLYCEFNQLTGLDLSKNTALTKLGCHDNQLTSLDLSKNTALDTLDCSGNKRQITVGETGQFDLSALKGFDADRAVWPEGVTVENGILTVPYNTTSLTYRYDVRGNGADDDYKEFVLTFDEVKEPDLPDDSSAPADTGSTAGGAIAAVAVGGAAVWGGYELVTRVMLHSLLPEGAAIPASRGQLALLVWNTAGRPEPVNAPAFADVTDPDTARAAQWCVEQGLLTLKKDGSFDPDGWTPKFRVIQVWNKAFPKQ